MSKIKDIIQKLMANPPQYHDLSLLISKRVWLLVASIYYACLLFTVGGFYIGPISLVLLATITDYLYLVLTIATGWCLYALCEYAVTIYFPSHKWIQWMSLFIIILAVSIAISTHLGVLQYYIP